MPVNWKRVNKEHVVRACQLIGSGDLGRGLRGRGLFVVFEGQRLPAKDVARVAYLIATDQPPDGYLDFSSGQATLDMFTNLGFQVERSAIGRHRVEEAQ